MITSSSTGAEQYKIKTVLTTDFTISRKKNEPGKGHGSLSLSLSFMSCVKQILT